MAMIATMMMIQTIFMTILDNTYDVDDENSLLLMTVIQTMLVMIIHTLTAAPTMIFHANLLNINLKNLLF